MAEETPNPPTEDATPLARARHAVLHQRLARLETLIGFGAAEGEARVPAWLRRTAGEQRWPVGSAILGMILLQIVIRNDLTFRPRYLLPGLELALLIALTVANPVRISRESRMLRALGLTLVVAASLATAWSAYRLVWELVHGHIGEPRNAVPLLVNGGAIWLTNVLVFALWYWDFDRGGPAARAVARVTRPDFLFAEMTQPELVSMDWEPTFVDYLYLSFTNATAFSPTDTLPLSRWAKLTMMFQASVSLATLALVVARAVNILS